MLTEKGFRKEVFYELIILLGVLIIGYFIIKVVGELLFKKDEVRELAQQVASHTIYYGDYEPTNTALALEVGAEGWRFSFQDSERFLKTGEPATPYVATNTICYESPDNKDLMRCLRKTWIYDDDCIEWIPLFSSVIEYMSGNIKKTYKILSTQKFWEGDFGSVDKFCQ